MIIYSNYFFIANIVCFLVYSLVGVCVLLLRYNNDQPNEPSSSPVLVNDNSMVYSNINASDEYLVSSDNVTILVWLKQYSNGITQFQKNLSNKNFFNKKTNAVLIIVFIFFSNLLFSGLLNNLNHDLIVIASLMLAVNLVLAIVLSLFKQAYIADSMSFRVSHLEIIFYYLILEVCFN